MTVSTHRCAVHVCMWKTFLYDSHMDKMIQIRNVPESLHRTIKARAAMRGQSLSEFLLHELTRIAARPGNDEILARLQARPAIDVGESSVDALRSERGARR